MPDDPMIRLAAADPAAAATLDPARRAALLAQVLATPVRPARRPRRLRRRTAVLVLVGMLAVAAGGAGAAGLFSSQTPAQVTDDYAQVIETIPLPPGYRWPGSGVDRADGVFAGHRAALVIATTQGMCAWEDAWLNAAGPISRAAAVDGYVRVFSLAPRHPAGASEDVGGMDRSVVTATQQLISAMRAGDRGPAANDLALNCAPVRRSARSPG